MTHSILYLSMVAQALTGLLFEKNTQQSETKTLVIESTKIAQTKFELADFNFDQKHTEKDSPFVINGSNKTATVAELKSLAGKSIAEIEQQLRSKESGSTSALLGKDESLLALLAADNKFVVEKHGLTHKQLAAPLLIFDRLHNEKQKQTGTIDFGKWFHSLEQSPTTFGTSPFLRAELNDAPCRELKLGRGFNPLRTKRSFKYSTKVAQTIYSHGFYGGKESPDRISPEEIIDFFSPKILRMFDFESVDKNAKKRKSLLKIKANKTVQPDLTVTDMGFDKPAKDEGTEFVLNAKNDTALILKLPTIANRTIADLELQMRPGAPGKRGSKAGFIGTRESLLEVLAADNRLVVEEHGLTHQQVAVPLLILTQINRGRKQSGRIKYGDTVFTVNRSIGFGGLQHSPFGDELQTARELSIYNSQTKKSLEFSPLVPMMIYRYGFYEGKGTSYRVPPEKIIDFFGEELLKSIKLPSAQ